MYGRLAASCGYTYSQIDDMTLPQVDELMRYFADHPPVHELVAAYIGFRRSGEPTACTKISPTLGEIPDARPAAAAPKPANDLGLLVSMAKKRGGNISLADLRLTAG